MSDKPQLQVKFSPQFILNTPKSVNKIVIRDTPKHSGWVWFVGISVTVIVTLGFIAGLIWILL